MGRGPCPPTASCSGCSYITFTAGGIVPLPLRLALLFWRRLHIDRGRSWPGTVRWCWAVSSSCGGGAGTWWCGQAASGCWGTSVTSRWVNAAGVKWSAVNNCAADTLQPRTDVRYLRENRLRLVVFVPPVCEKKKLIEQFYLLSSKTGLQLVKTMINYFHKALPKELSLKPV